MDRMQKELEVFNYVKENASEFLSVIVQALVAGIHEKNAELREQKSKVEVAIVILADKTRLEKLDASLKSALIDGLKSCTFIKVDSLIEKLGVQNA